MYENKTHTQNLQCWEEYKGRCKLISTWWDFCACHATKAPNIKCSPTGACTPKNTHCASPTTCQGG